MDTIVVSHTSALCAIRSARRAYSALPWTQVGRVEQRQALAGCVPNKAAIDFENLARYGAWEGLPTEKLDVLVADRAARRRREDIACHLAPQPLPPGSLMRLEHGLYCCSPALAALQYARGKSLGEVIVLLMELLGSYTLPPEATHPIAWGGRWPDKATKDSVEQAHYGCEPATSIRELKAIARWARSSKDRVFCTAVACVVERSASPGESIMFGMLGIPMRYGGFGLSKLGKRGMELNKRLDFSAQAVHMSSGMPYAICDAYIQAAHVDIEYNGAGHEQENARIHDGNRNNGLRGMGVKVLVINREQMRDIQALEAIARNIYHDAGERFRYRADGYRMRQMQLLNDLRKGAGLPFV